jgi:hypothetical protein
MQPFNPDSLKMPDITDRISYQAIQVQSKYHTCRQVSQPIDPDILERPDTEEKIENQSIPIS